MLKRRCTNGFVEEYDSNINAWVQTDEECDVDNFRYIEMGYKNKKEYENYIKDAQALWKRRKRKIIHEDEITKEEKEVLMKDTVLARMIKEKKAIDEFIEKRIDMKLKEIRENKEE